MSRRNILCLMSGSIACAKATSVLSEWVKRGHRVRVACTPSVAQFVGPATLEGLTGEPVFDDAFAAGRAMDHISLAQWADLVVVCPATSNLLNKLAAGLADDAVSTLWQAAWGREMPIFVVPAMNSKMWRYPATQRSVATLREWGVHVLPTAEGDLACGEHGEGRMLEPMDIVARIERLLDFEAAQPASGRPTGRRILVTGGGTREAIDPVRYIGNHSTGRTAAVLSEELTAAGHSVTWLGAESALRPRAAERQETFVSFADLERQLQRLLAESSYDLVIHAAAVSDFSVAGVVAGDAEITRGEKMPSDQDLTIRLERNPKLLDRIREYSCNPEVKVVGFKLTAGADAGAIRAAVDRLFATAHADAVVHNDLALISPDRHAYTVHRADGRQRALADSRALARALEELVE